MDNLKHNLSDSLMTDLASHTDNDKGNINKNDDNDKNTLSFVHMDDPGTSSSPPPAKSDLEELEKDKPLDDMHEALNPNLQDEIDCQGAAAFPDNSLITTEGDSEVNKTLTKVYEKSDSDNELNSSTVNVPVKRKASLSPVLSSLKSNSKSDSDEIVTKIKSNRKRRVIQSDEDTEKDNVNHILTESSSSKKSDSPLPQRKTRSEKRIGGSPTDFMVISDEEIDLTNSTINMISAEVLEQLKEVEDLRYKSKNLQGPISRRMRTLLDRMRKSISTITSRYEATASYKECRCSM